MADIDRSPAFSLDRVDRRKIRRAFLLALGGLALTVGQELLTGFDVKSGVGLAIAAFAPAVLDAVRRWMKDNESDGSFQ